MWRWLLLVDPRVFWAPGPAVGPGCAVRAASVARRFGSLSGQAPPPTGTTARSPAFRSLRCRGPGPAVPPMPSTPVAVGVLQH